MDVQQVAFFVGIALGSIAVLSACVVWLRHQTFGAGGAGLSLVGVALVGLSLWTSISFSMSEGGFEARFDRLEGQVSDVASATETVTTEVQKIAEATETSRTQIVDLTQVLAERKLVAPEAASSIRAEAARAPRADAQELSRAAERLRAIQ